MADYEDRRNAKFWLLIKTSIGGTLLVCGMTVGSCWAMPKYHVYEQRMDGEAELQKAEYSKRVAVEIAKAAKDSAVLLADAEALRADGVARANKIIGDSLKDNESYLRYLWIHSLQDGKNEVIYVPTEANLPILEADRFRQRGQKTEPAK